MENDRVQELIKASFCKTVFVPAQGRYSEIKDGIEKYRRCVFELPIEDQNGRYKNAIRRLQTELISKGEAAAVRTAIEGFPDIRAEEVFPDAQSRNDFIKEMADAFFDKKSFDVYLDAVENLAGLVRQRYAMRYAACLTQTFHGRPYLPVPGLYWSGNNRCWYRYDSLGEWAPDYRFPPLDVVEKLAQSPKARALLNIELSRTASQTADVRPYSGNGAPALEAS